MLAQPRRRAVGLALLAAVLLLRVGLLRGLLPPPATHFNAVAVPAGRSVQLQLVPRNSPAIETTAGFAVHAPVDAAQPWTPADSTEPAVPPGPRKPLACAGEMPVEPTPALQRVTASRLEQATPPDTVQAVAGAPAAAPDSAAVPVYATRIAAPVGLHYALRRDTVTGTAELQWRRQHDEYELLLEGTLQGTAVLSSISRGRIDAHGVAPQRHAERQRPREVRAANLRRDSGVISISAPDLLVPLPPRAQDRLSWLIQLPAIFEADPALRVAGAQVTQFVVGTRGDAQPWRFQVQGGESLELPAGPAPEVLRLLREPSRPFDTRAEVWLEPARHHLPVRAVFTTVPGGQPLEMQLSHIGLAVP